MASTRKRLASTILHFVSILSLANGFYLLFKPGAINEYMATQKGGHWQFLTILGLALSLAEMVVALMIDLWQNSSTLKLLKNAIGTLAVPLELIISVLYWSIVSYDKNLMVDPASQIGLPLALDLSIHAFPAVFLLADFLFFSPPFSKQTSPILLSTCATISYGLWIEYTKSYNKRYPYPFLNQMTTQARLGFYLAVATLVVLLFHAANRLHFVVDHLLGRSVIKAKRQTERKIK